RVSCKSTTPIIGNFLCSSCWFRCCFLKYRTNKHHWKVVVVFTFSDFFPTATAFLSSISPTATEPRVYPIFRYILKGLDCTITYTAYPLQSLKLHTFVCLPADYPLLNHLALY